VHKMAEKITLTVPYQPNPAVATEFTINRIVFDWKGAGIHITLGQNGVEKTVSYNGEVATILMNQLNVVNLATKSLHKRCIERLVADGHLAGTISGTPE
jgi:hypothetical protein